MKLIKFSNGMFGVRRWSLFRMGFEYRDFVSRFWWKKDSRYFSDCMTNEKSARDFVLAPNIKDEVIK